MDISIPKNLLLKIHRMTLNQTMLWILILTACGVTPLIRVNGDEFVCHNVEYAGPIKEVIQIKPTKLAEKTSNAAKHVKGLAIAVASGVIAKIPVAGSILGAVFKELAGAFGNKGLQAEDVYNSLKKEIDQLKSYVDQEIDEVKLDYIKKAFGTSRGGILSYAMHCQKTYQGDADDIAPCLENVNAMLTQQYHFFMPSDSRLSSYEFSLPLFRMYGELFVDTVMEQIAVAMTRGKETQAAAMADTLITKVKQLEEHYTTSLVKIAKLHAEPHVSTDSGKADCALIPYHNVRMCICTLAIGPNKISSSDTKDPAKSLKNFCVGVYYGTNSDVCKIAKKEYFEGYAEDHVQAIKTYWKKQVGDTVESWTKTAEALEGLREKVKR